MLRDGFNFVIAIRSWSVQSLWLQWRQKQFFTHHTGSSLSLEGTTCYLCFWKNVSFTGVSRKFSGNPDIALPSFQAIDGTDVVQAATGHIVAWRGVGTSHHPGWAQRNRMHLRKKTTNKPHINTRVVCWTVFFFIWQKCRWNQNEYIIQNEQIHIQSALWLFFKVHTASGWDCEGYVETRFLWHTAKSPANRRFLLSWRPYSSKWALYTNYFV